MASSVFSTNVTKYNNLSNGTGQIGSAIPDGYVKAVENLWLDSYTIAFTATKTTLDIAVLPPNKKITGIDVSVITSISQTSGALAIGFSEDSAYGVLFPQTSVTHNLTLTTLSLVSIMLNNSNAASGRAKHTALQRVTTGTQTTITLQFNNWTMTTGTVRTVVRYT